MHRTRGPACGSALVCLVMVSMMCMGMGGLGERNVITKIPQPDRLFIVEVVDTGDVSFSVRGFSMEGLTLIPVKAGKAKLSLDFAELLEIRLFLQGQEMLAQVDFRNGASHDFSLDPELSFFGLTDWGKLNLRAEDIRRITFKEQVANPGSLN